MKTDGIVKSPRYKVSIALGGQDEVVRPNPEGTSRDWLVIDIEKSTLEVYGLPPPRESQCSGSPGQVTHSSHSGH